ncbi:hypothetical protein EVAR_18527_1 [Eumeta japonica]|uniref:Uncharacterized protein n=1 Tax=Eumeta variegata TaxID=151549 RepID=A0A4C1V3B7_EUMVA|nr:hypothetical protein EVAR_18527_1 [Eumeta japonica]
MSTSTSVFFELGDVLGSDLGLALCYDSALAHGLPQSHTMEIVLNLVSCHNKTEASRVTVTDSPNSETKLPRSYWSISTRGRHVPLAGPSPFFHVATCYTSASASAPHQFMRMRMSKLMRMFRMCGCGCEYSQHP